MKRSKSNTVKDKMKTIVKPTKKKVFLLALIVAAVAVFGYVYGKKEKVSNDMVRTDDIVTRGDLEVTITGSASVEPLERYEIIPKVSGDITYCPYDVGDIVHKDDVLYKFDSSDSDLTVERQKISMQQSENNYRDALEETEKLSVKAKSDGVISDLTIQVGQDVKMGTKIASIEDTTLLEVVLPFTQAQIDFINVGDSATITSSKHMSAISGNVTHKTSASYAGSDGSALYDVTVQFANPGAFYAGMEVGGSIGEYISPGSGTIKNSSSGTVETETEGTVVSVNYSNGDYVTSGTVIATLSSETIAEKIEDSTLSLKSANLSMQQTEKDLENYNITSPINGTVITKNSKAGDTIDKTNSSTTMMVIADISKLKFELAIDELDVSKVQEGQPVSVTCDALPEETYTGIITNVSVEGTAQNGVTTYSAEVEIAEPGNLRPSMNIDAEIIVQSARNVLMIPTSDIKTFGGKSFVFVKDENASGMNNKMPGGDAPKSPMGENGKIVERPSVPMHEDGKQPQMPEMPRGTVEGTMPQGEGMSSGGAGKRQSMLPEAPEGYRFVEIQIGIANEDFTEVISGLTEGQAIYKLMAEGSGSTNMMMGGMHGMPGGMGGGMPGGMGSMGARPGGMR